MESAFAHFGISAVTRTRYFFSNRTGLPRVGVAVMDFHQARRGGTSALAEKRSSNKAQMPVIDVLVSFLEGRVP